MSNMSNQPSIEQVLIEKKVWSIYAMHRLTILEYYFGG